MDLDPVHSGPSFFIVAACPENNFSLARGGTQPSSYLERGGTKPIPGKIKGTSGKEVVVINKLTYLILSSSSLGLWR